MGSTLTEIMRDSPDFAEGLLGLARGEREAVRALGERIGYGRTMQLCEELWGEKLVAETGNERLRGGAHSVGTCVAFLVPCACENPAKCEWCCGAGRVTKRVLQAIRESGG